MPKRFHVIEGGEPFYCVPGSIVRHLRRDCPAIARSARVREVREVDLWPGFLCTRCRRRTMHNMDMEQIQRERPERIERADVLAMPTGGPVFGTDCPLAVHGGDPVRLDFPDGLSYLRWNDGGDVAYWRSDVFERRFLVA